MYMLRVTVPCMGMSAIKKSQRITNYYIITLLHSKPTYLGAMLNTISTVFIGCGIATRNQYYKNTNTTYTTYMGRCVYLPGNNKVTN